MKIWINENDSTKHKDSILVNNKNTKKDQWRNATNYCSYTIFTDIFGERWVNARAWKKKYGYDYSTKEWRIIFNKEKK